MQGHIDQLVEALVGRLFVPLEASGRHVHVTKEQAQTLFGHGLTPERPLSQPGQYLAKERLTVVGPKGEFQNVAVLGPERKEAQIEVSLTDARVLGLSVPVHPSGDVSGSPGGTLIGPKGRVELSRGVIAAQRHIHMTPQDARQFHVTMCWCESARTLPPTFIWTTMRPTPAASKREIWGGSCHEGTADRQGAAPCL